MADVIVYVPEHEGAFNKDSLGVLSQAATVARELGGEAHALVHGEPAARDACATLGHFGAAKVYRGRGPGGLAQPAVDAMAEVMAGGGYAYAMLAGGVLGFEIGGGLAARVDAGLAVEVTRVAVRDRRVVATRPILGESLLAAIEFPDVGIVVARAGAFEPVVVETGLDVPVQDIVVEPSELSLRTHMISRGERRGVEADLESAEVIVAGGRGLGRAEGFELCEQLARAFGTRAAVAATRAAVDAGWYPYASQVGQTGKTVAPRLYLAAGISGAVQHRVGMQGAENVLAINSDPGAPIFELADLGIVGDLNEILPTLAAAIRARHDGGS
jgi:electron transfer flavoprotein alpha subunit